MTRSLQLMVLMGKVVPAPAPPALVDALQSARITSSSGATSGFQLTFAVGRQSPVSRVMLPGGLLDPKTRVIVVAVVAGLPHVLMDGVITRHEMNPGQTPGSSTLTLTGEDLSLLMDLGHVERGHPGLPHHLRVMTVCAQYAQYGIVPVAVPRGSAPCRTRPSRSRSSPPPTWPTCVRWPPRSATSSTSNPVPSREPAPPTGARRSARESRSPPSPSTPGRPATSNR